MEDERMRRMQQIDDGHEHGCYGIKGLYTGDNYMSTHNEHHHNRISINQEIKDCIIP